MKIILRNYSVVASVGVYNHEKVNKTKLLISVTLETDNAVFVSKNHIVDYDKIINILKIIPVKRHFEYIEEIGTEVATEVKNLGDHIQNIVVKVQKCIMGNVLEELAVEIHIK
jgi:dihydroneopterin aldolase